MKEIECFEVRSDDGTGTPSVHVAYFLLRTLANLAADACSGYGKVTTTTVKVHETWAEYKGIENVEHVRHALDRLTPEQIQLLGLDQLARDARQ